ncbi:ABC transporter ATP-binding protein [Radiobacillus kanasensis]|uniref:ABC transporter ATP-binding protein n=1 Tax=Radiobacillus kanasensis TaxID=2844358 RepID=UPI001E3EC4EA|nr:ABC transporter ATP-binding protein [Radiobacillus kanasensis]UFT98634.1 ABC transporter ATP-binding protein [Radiobacillus kanasensis]
MESLELKGITKQFDKEKKRSTSRTLFSLKQTDIVVNKGEFFSLLGPSGCGKTTLLKLTAGLLIPDQGEVWLDHENLTSVVPEKRDFGLVFQEPLLFPHMTVVDNVAFGLKMKKVGKRKRLEKSKAILEAVGLKGLEHRYPHALSGGQKQRVSLARAIVVEPHVLLMDEPFSALDPETRQEMRDLIAQMHRRYNITILFVTHDRQEAFQLSDRIAIMKNGQVLEIGRPKELYECPSDPEVARFLGVNNIIYGCLQDGVFKSNQIQLHLPSMYIDQKQAGCVIIRPETLSIIKADRAENNELNLLDGIVLNKSFNQGFDSIKVQVGAEVLEVVQRAEFSLAKGESVFLKVDQNQLHFIPH